MKMRLGCGLMAVAGWVLSASTAPAQQIVNGDFALGAEQWTTNYGHPEAHVSVYDINGDGRNELVFDAATLTNQYLGVLAFQNIPAEYVNLNFGIALAGNVGATNLPGDVSADIKTFTKMEFLDGEGSILNELTMSGEYDPAKYATGNETRAQTTLIKNYSTLTGELAAAGFTMKDIATIRAGCFMFRFDTANTVPSGKGYFGEMSMGLVSGSFNLPGVVNGQFEYDDWWWRQSPTSVDSGWSTVDVDGDGDKELRFEADGLTGQYSSRLWVQETDARMIDFEQGLSLTADLMASNLTSGLRVFHKIEFGRNGPPYQGSVIPGVFVSSEDPSMCARTNEVRLGSTLNISYENLTNMLWNNGGYSVSDVTFVRTVVFLMQFDAAPPTPSGFAAFDNVRMDVKYKNPPTASSALRNADNAVVLSWTGEPGSTYRVQKNDSLSGFQWTNLVAGLAGQEGEMSYSNQMTGAGGFIRLMRD
ncbi:MAG: hypothetical protein V2A34_14470 [Lentisphaerota bacterium]